jgi:HPt (histidine-containing phosphotransfer) domain-containing protein
MCMDGSMSNAKEPIIDLQKLYIFSGNSKSTVNSIIQVFLNESPKQMENLSALVAARKWNNVKALSHNMKSSYAVLGANSVKELLEAMETKCELNKVDEDEFKSMLNTILVLNEQVINSIRASAFQYGE